MGSADDSGVRSRIVRLLALPAWTWIAFAAIGGAVFTSAPIPPALRRDAIPYPTSFDEAFASVLTFDFGYSLWIGGSARSAVLARVGTTLSVLLQVLLIALLVGGGLVLLSRRSPRWRRFVAMAGYLGALPASTWLLAVLWLDRALGLPGVAIDPGGPFGYWPAALAVGLPLAALLGRIAVRPNDGTIVPETWLFVSWAIGTVLVVGRLYGIGGVGDLLHRSITAQDAALFLAVAGGLVLVTSLLGAVRDLLWIPDGALADRFLPQGPGTDADSSRSPPPPGAGIRELSRRTRVGLLGFAGLLALGLLGSAILPEPRAGSGFLSRVVAGLAWSTTTALASVLRATIVGGALGVLAISLRRGESIASLVLGYGPNVPPLVWLFLAVYVAPLNVVGLAGFAVAPLVGAVLARGVDDPRDLSTVGLRAAGSVAVVGAGVVTLVSAQPTLLGYTSSAWGSVSLRVGSFGTAALRIAIALGLPVVSLFLLGDGLRRPHGGGRQGNPYQESRAGGKTSS